MSAAKASRCAVHGVEFRGECPACKREGAARGFPAAARAPAAAEIRKRKRAPREIVVNAVRVTSLPARNGTGRIGWEAAILDTLRASPGEWFKVAACEDAGHASSTAAGARKRHPLPFEWRAIAGDVYARKLKP